MTSEERLDELAEQVAWLRGKRELLLERRDVETKAIAAKEHETGVIDSAVEVLQAATETRRQDLKERVESLVTRGLRAVFGREDFEFGFNVAVRRSVIAVTPVLRSKYGEHDLEATLTEGHGGGIADVVSFLLRVIVLTLTRPRAAPVLVLDESFRHVSPEYLQGVSGLIRELNETAKIQFLLVTHKPELLDAADVIYRASLHEGETTFTLEHESRDRSYHQAPRRGQRAPDDTTLFDHQDMTRPDSDAEPTLSATEDVLARQQRYQATLDKDKRSHPGRLTKKKTRKKRKRRKKR